MTTLALVLAVALSSGQVAGVCGAGRNCRVRTLTTTTPSNGTIAVQVPNLDFVYFGNSCGLRANGSNLTATAACNFAFGTGQQGLAGGGLYFTNFTSMTSATAPSVLVGAATLVGESNTGRFWKSDGAAWTDVQSGAHPVMDRPIYWIDTDRAGAGAAPIWRPAPRSAGADLTITSVGLTSGGTGGESPARYDTTAVIGNQVHQSSSATFFRGTPTASPYGWRWCTRFAPFGAFTGVRYFLGASSALPVASGTATPTTTGVMFRYDTTAGDTSWQACSANAAALSCTVTNPAVAPTGAVQTMCIDCREAACTFWVDGVARARLTSSLPSGSTQVGVTQSAETTTAAVRQVFIGTSSIESR